MAARVAILLDGGFVTKRLKALTGRFPTPNEVVDLTARIMDDARFKQCELFRVYFYDAPPLTGVQINPLSGKPYDFSAHPSFAQSTALQAGLAMAPDFAFRRGEVVFRGWTLRTRTLRDLETMSRPLNASDLGPNIVQKAVDVRIGLDVAALSMKRIVETIVLVTGDSDFVPAMKFARREGTRVCLDTLGHTGTWPELIEHADYVMNSLVSPSR